MPVDWVTFDCYGTLVDWESGIYEALAPLLALRPEKDAFVKRYIAIEAEVESGEYLSYRDVLDRAGRRLLVEHGMPIRPDEPCPLPASLPEWRPFPEVPNALRALRAEGRRIAVLSNVDRDLLAASLPRLGIEPDLAVTAQDCGSYKPAPGHWRYFQERSGSTSAHTIHVGASLYHDMVPAAALGYRTVFINRHDEPLGDVRPTRVLRDLAALPRTIDELSP